MSVTMDMTRAIGSILPPKNSIPIYMLYLTPDDDDTQLMDMTIPFSNLNQTPQRHSTPTPESSPFYNSPLQYPVPAEDAEITRSPLSTGISGTPKRTPSRGLIALDLLTGKPLTPLSRPAQLRRKSDSGLPLLLGSPRAANRLRSRKSIAGLEEFTASAATRRVSIGRESWSAKEFGGDISRVNTEIKVRDMIAKMTPRKQPHQTPSTPVRTPSRTPVDEIMLTPGIIKHEFGPKAASPVKLWEQPPAGEEEEEEEEDFAPITLAEFLSMTNISFLDGLGPSTSRRRTYAPPEGLHALQKPMLRDYAKAGAVSIPMLELYQFVQPPEFLTPQNFFL